LGFPFGGCVSFFSVSVYVLFFAKKSKNRKRFCCGSLLGLLPCGNLLCGVLEVCVVEFFCPQRIWVVGVTVREASWIGIGLHR
jgi:hypothetical protein